jgi:predicted enzyme related to lactoylglutathione lyase
MAVTSLKLLVLRTTEVQRLLRFYQALGIEFREERHGDGPLHHAGRIGDAVLELYPLSQEGGQADSTVRLGFAVTDLAATLFSLEAAGETVINRTQQTEWGWRAVVRDPDGRAVELYQG